MRQSRFTEAQIIGMIKEQEAGMPTVEVCRRHGVASDAGSPSTTTNALTLPMADNHPPWYTLTELKPISRCRP
jgi:hypothetical protein